MDRALVQALLDRAPSDTLAFRPMPYPFDGAAPEQRAELVRDLLALANTCRAEHGYLVVGVRKGRSGPVLGGAGRALKNEDVRRFINSRTNRPIDFVCATHPFGSTEIGVIWVKRRQQRPLFLREPLGELPANAVFVRRGGLAVLADPDEIVALSGGVTSSAPSLFALEFSRLRRDGRERLGTAAKVTSVIVTGERATERRERALLSTVSCWVQNVGDLVAEDVRVELIVPRLEGLVVVDAHDPTSKVIVAGAPVLVHAEKERWVVEAHVGKLQPKQERWLPTGFLVGSSVAVEAPCVGRLFDDALATPQEVELRLTIEVVHRKRSGKTQPARPKRRASR